MTSDRTHSDHERNPERDHRRRARREDFVEVVVDDDAGDQPRGEDRYRSGRARRFDRDNSSPIEIEVGGATVRVLPRTDRVLLNIVLDALRGRR